MEEIEVFSYKITLNLFYIHKENSFDSDDGSAIEEPQLTLEEVDEFMKGSLPDNSIRYIVYAQNVAHLLTYGNDIEIADIEPFEIEYTDGGILTFCIDLSYEEDIQTIYKTILLASFEDGMMEGMIGNECIVPSRNKYPIKLKHDKLNIPIHTIDHYELGYIDCRENYTIRVEKI